MLNNKEALKNAPKKLVSTFRKIKQSEDLQNIDGSYNTHTFVINMNEQKISYSSIFTKKKTFKFDQIDYAVPNISVQTKKLLGDWVHTFFIKFKENQKMKKKNILLVTNQKDTIDLWTYLLYLENKIKLLIPYQKNRTMSGVIVQMQKLPNLQVIMEMDRDIEDSNLTKIKNGFRQTFNSIPSVIENQEMTPSLQQQKQSKLSQISERSLNEELYFTGTIFSQSSTQNQNSNDPIFNQKINVNQKDENQLRKSIKQLGSSLFKISLTDTKKLHHRVNSIEYDDDIHRVPEEGDIKLIINQKDKFLIKKINTLSESLHFENYNNFNKYSLSHSLTFNS
ncbi:hypothetical protein ABPG72_022361 [Tetrahymena utriculariae]